MTQPVDDRLKVTSIPSITRDDHESGKYKWNKNKCKVFLLYCNESEEKVNRPSKRRTSDWEIPDLKECLKCWLGKDVVKFKKYRNFTREMLNDLSKEIQKEDENKKYDCFIFIFLTCGFQDRIFCCDGEISTTDILDPIKKEPSMALKPKLFFIQVTYCMVDIVGLGSWEGNHGDESLAKEPVIIKGREESLKLGEYEMRRVPQEADVFIQQCILPESLFPVKGKDNEYECIFVTALMETVRHASTQLDIHQLSLKINAAVDKRLQTEHEKSKQENRKTIDFDTLPIPEITSTLTKALYFPFRPLVQSQR